MKTFYNSYKDNTNLQLVAGEIGWSQNIILFTNVKEEKQRYFYAKVCANRSWSKIEFLKQIKGKLFENSASSQNNFDSTLDQNLLNEIRWEMKDEYNLGLIELSEQHLERQLEDAIVKNIIKFMGELGSQFCFVGRQFRLENPNGKEYFIDLLFYHRTLKSLIAVELKSTEFKVEYGSKMALYLSMLDDYEKKEGENQSIGIIICKSKDRFDVEYALKDLKKPIGIATYGYEELPKTIAKYLPSIEDLEEAINLND
jgi:predicted nuclease of restriction endonuclease-like (RecB) superfamily